MAKRIIKLVAFSILFFILIGSKRSVLDETNPIKLVLHGMLYIYQSYITTQDNQECQFKPSCSAFAVRALSIADPVQATLMVADRLQRCNPFAHYYYKKASDNLHLLDPPEYHKLWGKGSISKLKIREIRIEHE